MKKIHLYASHPDYKKFDFMQHMLLIATNPQMFFGFEVDVLEPERLAAIELIKKGIKEEMDDYQFLPPNIAEHINKLEENMQMSEFPKKVEHICKNCKWLNKDLGECNNDKILDFVEATHGGFFYPSKDFSCNEWEKKD